jgi:beta-galactosidase
MQTRRTFLKSAAGATASALLPRPTMRAAIATLPEKSPNLVQRLSDGWEYLQGSLGGAWEVWHSEETAVWQQVAMPHSFNAYDACDPDTPYYRGNGWYRTHIAISNPYTDGRTLLHFEGSGQTTTVYVGETLAAHHVGGYDEFVVDITDLLHTAPPVDAGHPDTNPKQKRPAGTPIAVLCDNSRDLDRIPSDLSDFSLYGGMYRTVNLVYVPAVSLQRLHIRTHVPSPDSAAEITVFGLMYFPSAPATQSPVKITVDVVDGDGASIHRSSKVLLPSQAETELASFTIAKPKLWSPRSPHLYRCTVTISGAGGDYVAHETFGLKHTEMIEHGPFKLNGDRLLLRGTHRHEDHAGYANAMPDNLIEEEMLLIKSMGANFIRLAHYQQSRQVLELCDRLGILVWEEIPWCRGGVGDDTFKNMVREKLNNMIGQHFNHVSVLFWGLGNEDDWPTEYPGVNQQNIRDFMQELNNTAHQLDPSRYTSLRRCDFARDIPDVYSPSIWAGWYRGTYPEYQQTLEAERDHVNHLIHIEWGADSHAGRHSENPDRILETIASGNGTDERGLDYLSTGGEPRVSRDGDWSETYACNLFDWHLKTQETLPWFIGSAQWIFKDFTTPLRVENPVPRINQKGVIQRDMAKKESFYVFQSYWSEEPMVRLYGHTWPVRWGEPTEPKMVKVYSNCDTAELFLNGVSVGIKHRNSQDFPAAGLRWTTPFLAGKNQLRVVAKRNSVTVEDAIEFEYQTEKWGAPATLQLKEKNRAMKGGKQTVAIEATLHDASGVLCLDAKTPVRFSVAGRATLIDNLGTPQGSRLVQMYNGRAEITLVCNTGLSVAAVTSEGIPAAICSLPSTTETPPTTSS